jgi:TolB-like protein/class 3 adenylate cyclase/Tfp pilus assembly protein PilF
LIIHGSKDGAVKVEHVERKLTTVLAADVAGYSRLMGADEEGTLARLKTLRRELIDPKIKEHQGRTVKTTGDGTLVEFVSPVEAVRCAVEVQAQMALRNATVAKEQRIEFRVGINLGDVIVEAHDLYGDGVNIAARLEAIAEPGGICISRTVRDHIRDKLAYPFVDTGEQSVKNIARPVRVYALSAAAIAALPSAEAMAVHPLIRPFYARRQVAAAAVAVFIVIGGGLWWLWPSANGPSGTVSAPGLEKSVSGLAATTKTPSAKSDIAAAAPLPRLSIVVLPFANLSSDPEQEYFAEGLTDNVTTDVSRISGSFVIARNTAATYKGKAISVVQIGSDLGVRYALEGSVQRDAKRILVNAQLIDAQTGAHLWAERFMRGAADLLEMQDDITRRIAVALSATLLQAESDRVVREHRTNPDAIDLTMRASALLNKPESPDGIAEARRLFEQALKIDADNVDALVGLAYTHVTDWANSWNQDPAVIPSANDAVTRALAIEPRNAFAYYVKAEVLTYSNELDLRGRTTQAIAAEETAIKLNPNLAGAYARLGRLYARVGQPERTAALIEQAMRLSPLDPAVGRWLYAAGTAQLQMEHYDEAIDTFRRSVAANPNLGISWSNLTAAYLGAGRDMEAHQTFAEFQRTIRDPRDLPASPDDQLLFIRVKLELMRRGRWFATCDGYKGDQIIKALKSFQRDENLPITGNADETTLARLGVMMPAEGKSSN